MRLKMALLWCEVLINSAIAYSPTGMKTVKRCKIAHKRLRSNIIAMPTGLGTTRLLLQKLASLCLGIACTDAASTMFLQAWYADAATLTSLPKAVEVQTNQLPTSKLADKTLKACSPDATPSRWIASRYYWLAQKHCTKPNQSKSTAPEATTESSEETATLTLALAPELFGRNSFPAPLKVQELERDTFPQLSRKQGDKTETPALETWKTLTKLSFALLPGKEDNKSRRVAKSSSALALNAENLSVAKLTNSSLLPVSSLTEETSLVPKPLVFQGAALLAGDYKRGATDENANSRQIESQPSLSPAPFSSSPPSIENPSCPAPLIACTPSLQAQNPPTPTLPPAAPIAPENLQPNPNQERFLQPPPSPAPIAPDAQPPVQAPPTPTPSVSPSPAPQPSTAPNAPAIQVQKINVTGSTVFGPNQIAPIVQPFEGRTLTLEQLREVADAITQLYLNQGYITSRAILVDQAITDGVVEIRVLEGSLEDIQIEGARRVKPNYIRSRVRLGAKTPLNTAQLEDQVRLLRADPLFENVEASLRAGTRTGQSILIVRVVEANPFEGSVGVDNYSPPSVGSERLGVNLLYRNLTGNGDAIGTSFYHTTRSGADSLDLTYRLPVNAMNGAVQLRTSLTRNNIVDPTFSFLDIQGDSQLYEISFQQPLIRSPREEFALSLGFAYQDSKSTSIFGPLSPGANTEGVTTTSVIKFGQDYLRRDVKGAWSLRSLFSFGTGLFGATTNSPPDPDGRFISWLGQVQRVQILGDNNFLIVGADIQLTPNRLLPSQQFVIGGGQSLRGYRQNIRAGDNGVRFSLEDRITLERNEAGAATFQLAPFFDAGVVWNNDSGNRQLPPEQFLAGLGLGLIWEPLPRLSLRLDYGYPLIQIEDKGTNAQDEGFYFSVNYRF